MDPREKLLLENFELSGLHHKLFLNDWNSDDSIGITMTQMSVLDILVKEGPKRVKELAQSLHVTSGGVTLLSDKFIQQGLLKRIRNESDDRRSVIIEITEKGRELHRKGNETRIRLLSKQFEALTNEDIENWNRIYRKLNRYILENK
jgi:DNA-binding MarR family transcriptional regulator